ncbi:MAG TPA: class I SAM-dependent methyltransferase [Candidatus Acidoferrum sp.]|jgi:demethylmenaquinone methyltransferase/2-methoxy-6-polyprenyl-1,4-benzoquinol methylase|nr:class I SAM-dependent methyltransferase [Candidatus Acidoferrum sp.]
MANTFFEPGEHLAAKVNELFARIATRYDLINDLQSFGLHRYWKRLVVTLARPGPGQRALDLCCGTGDLVFALARQGVAVAGLDFNEQMLGMAVAKQSQVSGPKSKVPSPKSNGEGRRSTDHGPQATVGESESEGQSPKSEGGSVLFVRGDAQELPFRDSSFDIVTVGYGLRNLADWERGLSEMRRVAKPGGRLLVLDFGKPDNAMWRGAYYGYLRLFVPCLGLIFCGSASAYRYILESLQHYPAQQGVAGKMRELGLVNVRIVNLLGGVMTINYGEKG